ncbi:MAG: hypothetical protein K0S23_1228 [Fluviicola sp.]|jgi:hypothetical protein|uniref:hypothetical protein n=1 Tax=Fluviicola sp. TaxID=1917219 RepID=UPI00261077BE|nr:hypothetical protein [Fluviicola sp.]MDF3026921.1 hypothetical protein [Fluviicola sp.]
MKGKNIVIVVLLGLLLFLLGWTMNERERARRKDKMMDRLREENKELKMAYLSLLEKFLKANGVEPSVLEELHKLKSEIDEMETEIHVELESVIKRISDGEGTKAVKDLAKIVENTLKEKAKTDESFTNRRPMLNDLLLYAKEKGLICSRLYENGLKLKELRNLESHELAPSCSKLEIGMSVFAGIEIISAVR